MELKVSTIAKRAKVSKGTVSKVFNNYPSVSEQMRERVLDTITAMGGNPDLCIAGRSGNRMHCATRTFAVNVGNMSIFTRAMNAPRWSNDRSLAAFHQRLSELGYHLLVMPNFPDTAAMIKYLKAHYRKQFDGVVFLESIREEVVDFLVNQKIPTISMGGSKLNLPNCSVVNVSAAEGIGRVMDHLLSLGHRKIGYIGWWLNHDSMAERYQEYFYKLRRAGLEFRSELVYEGREIDLTATSNENSWEDQFAEVVKFLDGLIASGKLPTALVCATDDIAYRVVKHLEGRGVCVPKDVSVTGWGHDYGGETPVLTTIDDNPASRGKIAADHIIQVCGQIPDVTMRVNVPCELVEGETSGPVKKA